jgi:hypothetical protein
VLREIAFALAGLATRKPCVGPILKILFPLLQTPELSETAIRYDGRGEGEARRGGEESCEVRREWKLIYHFFIFRVLTRMWKLQDRVFPKLRSMVISWNPGKHLY